MREDGVCFHVYAVRLPNTSQRRSMRLMHYCFDVKKEKMIICGENDRFLFFCLRKQDSIIESNILDRIAKRDNVTFILVVNG